MFTYKYPRPALTVDCAIFCKHKSIYHILLIQRANPPFQNLWAFPGGFVDIDEDIDDAAYRELKEETGFEGLLLHQFQAYGKPGRDPRGRTVSVVHYAVLDKAVLPMVEGADDALKAKWIPLNQLPVLAFDHQQILDDLLNNLSI